MVFLPIFYFLSLVFLLSVSLAQPQPERALARRAIPASDPPVRVRSLPSQTTAPSSTPEDYALADIALVLTVDGSIHALKRETGTWVWSLHEGGSRSEGDVVDLRGPGGGSNVLEIPVPAMTPREGKPATGLVRSRSNHTLPRTHPGLAVGPGASAEDEEEDETYIIEPHSDGDIYVFVRSPSSSEAKPTRTLHKLPLSIAQLVGLSPFSFPGDDGRMFVGRKETTLVGVDLRTGRMVGAFGGEGKGWCDWREEGGLAGGGNGRRKEEMECEEDIRERPGELLYLGRTDYHLSIYSKSTGGLLQTLSYTSYAPSSLTTPLTHSTSTSGPRSVWTHTPDERYFQPMHDGSLICFFSGSDRIEWTNTFSSPVVSIWDVAHPLPASDDDLDLDVDEVERRARQTPPVLFAQPRTVLPPTFGAFSKLPEATYVGWFGEDLFAMSRGNFPLVAFAPEVGSKDLEDVVEAVEPEEGEGNEEAVGEEEQSQMRLGGKTSRRMARYIGSHTVENARRPGYMDLIEGSAPSAQLDAGPSADQPLIDGPAPSTEDADADHALQPSRGGDTGKRDPTAARKSSRPSHRISLDGSEEEESPRRGAGEKKRSGRSWLSLAVTLVLFLASGGLWVKRSDNPSGKLNAVLAQWGLTAVLAKQLPSPPPPLSSTTATATSTKSADSNSITTTSDDDSDPASEALLRLRREKALPDLPPEDPPTAPVPQSPSRSRGKAAKAAPPSPKNSVHTRSPSEESSSPVVAEAHGEEPAEGVPTGKRGKRRTRGKKPGQRAAAAAAAAAAAVAAETAVTSPATAAAVVLSIVEPVEKEETVDGIQVTDVALGYGSHGTVVLKGTFQGRVVAVKRVLKTLISVAQREVRLLQDADDHPNVIRYFAQAQRNDFLYIALELCSASLADLIEKGHEHKDLVALFDPKKALRQIMLGVRHMHKLKLVHRDLKPQNILVTRTRAGPARSRANTTSDPDGDSSSSARLPPNTSSLRMVISDFGLCKELDFDQSSFMQTGNVAAGSFGYRAPEILRPMATSGNSGTNGTTSGHSSQTGSQNATLMANSSTASSSGTGPNTGGRLTKSIDIFALGCIFYYVMTNGEHPFGHKFERESNILKDNPDLGGLTDFMGSTGTDDKVESQLLVERMISHEAEDRPTADQVLLHPYFWDAHRRLTFLCDASDRFEIMCRDPPDAPLVALEARSSEIIGGDWYRQLDRAVVDNLGKYRKYDGTCLRDLLRVLRNKRNHYQDLPPNVQQTFGPLPGGFLAYFTRRSPALLLHIHDVVSIYASEEAMFRTYFQMADDM